MQQHLCDFCGEVLHHDHEYWANRKEDEPVFIFIALGSVSEGRWHEFHRRCARTLTLAQVYERRGTLPL